MSDTHMNAATQSTNRGVLDDRDRDTSLISFIRTHLPTIGVLLYAIMPIDLIPEGFLPVIGQFDDTILVILEMYRQWRVFKKTREIDT